MLTTTTTLNRLRMNLADSKVSALVFSQIVEIPTSTLTSALRGDVYLGEQRENQLCQASLRLRSIVEAIRPFTIIREDWVVLKALMNGPRTADEIRADIERVFEGVKIYE